MNCRSWWAWRLCLVRPLCFPYSPGERKWSHKFSRTISKTWPPDTHIQTVTHTHAHTQTNLISFWRRKKEHETYPTAPIDLIHTLSYAYTWKAVTNKIKSRLSFQFAPGGNTRGGDLYDCVIRCSPDWLVDWTWKWSHYFNTCLQLWRTFLCQIAPGHWFCIGGHFGPCSSCRSIHRW